MSAEVKYGYCKRKYWWMAPAHVWTKSRLRGLLHANTNVETSSTWTKGELLDELADNVGEIQAMTAKQVDDWMKANKPMLLPPKKRPPGFKRSKKKKKSKKKKSSKKKSKKKKSSKKKSKKKKSSKKKSKKKKKSISERLPAMPSFSDSSDDDEDDDAVRPLVARRSNKAMRTYARPKKSLSRSRSRSAALSEYLPSSSAGSRSRSGSRNLLSFTGPAASRLPDRFPELDSATPEDPFAISRPSAARSAPNRRRSASKSRSRARSAASAPGTGERTLMVNQLGDMIDQLEKNRS